MASFTVLVEDTLGLGRTESHIPGPSSNQCVSIVFFGSHLILQSPLAPAAISSYISLRDSYAYSIGGPSGEVHALSEERGFGAKVQELLYVPPDDLADADKTRKALVRRFANQNQERTQF